MRGKGDTPDQVVARVAARQRGVASIAQLRAAGLSHDAIRRRVQAGRLHRVHRGVFAVGHTGLAVEGRWIAAILAGGRGMPRLHEVSMSPTPSPGAILACWGAALSHRSAAQLWRLLPVAGGHIEVSVPGIAGKRGRRGVHIHRSRTLTPEMVTSQRGIPVTTPERTIADLRRSAVTKGCPAAVPPRELRRAIRQAAVLGLRVGEGKPDRTRSELEWLFLRLCKRYELPAPEVNARIDSLLVDFLWRDRRLIVETDGYRYHRGRGAFEEDRDRDLELKARGYEVIRLSYRQITEEPGRAAEVLSELLGAR